MKTPIKAATRATPTPTPIPIPIGKLLLPLCVGLAEADSGTVVGSDDCVALPAMVEGGLVARLEAPGSVVLLNCDAVVAFVVSSLDVSSV